METIYASHFGIKPNSDISKELADLIEYIKTVKGEKTAVFEKGVYYITADNCKKHELFITNTIAENEYKDGEIPHMQSVALYLEGIDDLVFDGSNSVFIISGKATNIAVQHCNNLHIKDLEIRHKSPDMHELKVVGKTLFSVDFQTDSDSKLEFIDGKPHFSGRDYCVRADKNAAKAFWTGIVRAQDQNLVKRTNHPLFGAIGYKSIDADKFRAYFLNTLRFKTGDRFYVYDARRLNAGIFINDCTGISLKNIKQRFNYSLAYVAQSSKDLSVLNCEFAPGKGSLKIASAADFMQVCMCRGCVSVKDNHFEGAGDDCINVHGIHFKIVKLNSDTITVRFMHPQSYGFDPFRAGDRIVFVEPNTLLESGSAVIKSSEMVDLYEIRLTLDNCNGAKCGMVVEDIDACPDFEFINNTVNRIITRGVLVTTRGKVNIKNNHFICTAMSGVLMSDDAKNWYESGPCRKVNIENNDFDYCGSDAVLIKPENTEYNGAVHKNISIINNRFKKYKEYCISAKDADNILIKGNKYSNDKFLKTDNCSDVTADDNIKRDI